MDDGPGHDFADGGHPATLTMGFPEMILWTGVARSDWGGGLDAAVRGAAAQAMRALASLPLPG